MPQFITEFFSSIPDALSALWAFSEGWRAVFVTIGSVILTAAFAFAALQLRERSGWLSSIFGMMATTIVFWWLFGIIPSAWVYFADAEQELLGGRLIPNALPALGNFYQVFRDTIVVVQYSIAMVAVVVAAIAIQKRYPRALAEGEESRPQSGGYK